MTKRKTLKQIDKGSQKFVEIVLEYHRAKEQGNEAELCRDLSLTQEDIQVLERDIALGNACAEFEKLRKAGGSLDLAEYLRERGFIAEDIARAKRNCEFNDSVKTEILHLFS